jgi:hypothetical protein
MICYIITKENGSAAMYGGALAPAWDRLAMPSDIAFPDQRA